MSIYISIYLIVIICLLFVGYNVYLKNRQKNIYLLFSLFITSLWLIIYFWALIITTKDYELLVLSSRILYSLAFISMYSMLFSIIFYNNKFKSRFYHFVIALLFILIFMVSGFTNLIIDGMVYDEISGLYYDSYGSLYGLYAFLYLFFLPLYIYFSYIKIKKLNFINKIRLKYLSIGFGIFIGLEILFLSILPIFGIRLFEKEQVLFFIPFILSVWYSIYRYNFLDLMVVIGKVITFISSILISVLLVNLFKFYFLVFTNSTVVGFWGITKDYGILDLLFGILIYIILYKYLNKRFLGTTEYTKITKKLSKIKQKIAFISDLSSLNKFLNSELKNLLKLDYVNINICSKNKLLGLKEYFLKDKSYGLFINDIVFTQENKNKFNYDLIKNEIDENVYLVFPLVNNKGEFMGVLELGHKPLKDNYTKEEVDIFKEFSSFLVSHLKYIEIYSEIHDLNVNLDKKIDEKTIEINNLVSKQSDFISMSSHEIKTPIASAIFQIDCILDEYKSGEIDKKILEKELDVLNNQLLKIGKLVNKIFKVEEYDIKEIKLYIEKINIKNLLEEEIDLFKFSNKGINIDLDIQENIGFFEIDRVQFIQVIDNLLNNAVKYSKIKGGNKNIKINISCYKEKGNIIFEIDDNGKGFNDVYISEIFDKYSTGESSSVGVGMGLYLCKKIVEMHSGVISADVSENLGGARFIINIPEEHNN